VTAAATARQPSAATITDAEERPGMAIRPALRSWKGVGIRFGVAI
jgi:hypothetical protein